MDVSEIPLHTKTTVVAEKFIMAVVYRNSKEEAIISYINLQNHQEVLRILQRTVKADGEQILKYVDTNYWDIYIDGKFITDYNLSIFKDLEVKIKVKTRDRLIEIISFDKRVRSNKAPKKQSIIKRLSWGK